MPTLDYYFIYKGVTLAPITHQDIPATVAMVNHAYSYQDVIKGEPRTSEERLQKRASESQLYVAKRNNHIVGCVYVEPGTTSMLLGLLTVTEAYRGKGLAAALLQAIERYAKSLKLGALELDYMSLAPWLKTYYQRYGFKKTGHITPWETIDLIRMRKPLTKTEA